MKKVSWIEQKENSISTEMLKKTLAFSLLEVLIVMALFIVMMLLAMPAWRSLSRSIVQRGSTHMLMNSLEQARMSALEKKRTTWIIFRHRQLPLPDDFCTLQQLDDGKIVMIASWISLPKGIIFVTDAGSFFQTPPTDIMRMLDQFSATTKSQERLTSIQFSPSGSITSSTEQDHQLLLKLGKIKPDQTITPFTTITLSPLTGRALLQK